MKRMMRGRGSALDVMRDGDLAAALATVRGLCALTGWAREVAAENGRLRNRVAELEDQTNTYPTEEDLSPEMRARLMPEGLFWPRLVDGSPLALGMDVWVSGPKMDGRLGTGPVDGVLFCADGVELWSRGNSFLLDRDVTWRLDPDDEEDACPENQVKRADDGPAKNVPIQPDGDREDGEGVQEDGWKLLEDDSERIAGLIVWHFCDNATGAEAAERTRMIKSELVGIIRRAEKLAGVAE